MLLNNYLLMTNSNANITCLVLDNWNIHCITNNIPNKNQLPLQTSSHPLILKKWIEGFLTYKVQVQSQLHVQ